MSNFKNFFLFILAIFLGVLLGIFFIYFVKERNNYVAVFFNNGNIYFGKLSTFPKLKLDNVLFLQVDQQGNISLQKLKDAVWQPKGPIYFNRSSVLFIAPLDKNSSLINLIKGEKVLLPSEQQPLQQQPLQQQPLQQQPQQQSQQPEVLQPENLP